MASILKFDTWQNSAGVTQQTVLQTKYSKMTGTVQVNTFTPTLVWNFPTITRTQAGSMFVVMLNTYIGYTNSVNGNPDAENPGMALYRDGSPVATGSSWGSGYFWGTDVPVTGAGTYGGQYDLQNKNFQFAEVPTGAVGTTFQYALYGTGQQLNVNRPAYSGTPFWGITNVTVMEIAQ